MSSPLERRLRDELGGRPAPGEPAAGRRSWPVIAAALGGRPPAVARPRTALRPALACLVVALALAATLTPAGAVVSDWIGERIGLGPAETQRTLTGFPRGGRLLAVSESGAWVVHPGGALRRLGAYSEVGWSPRGLFVLGTAANRVTAMEPDGGPRWSIVRRGRVSRPAWSPGNGFRVAYLERTGGALSARVADGSGRQDHRLRARVAPVTPAWRPGGGYPLTLVAAGGRILTLDADGGRLLWSASTRRPWPLRLAWTRDGRRLAVLLPGELDVYARDGSLLARHELPGGARALAMALHPGGRRAAVAVTRDGGSRVLGLSLASRQTPNRELFSGPGRFRDLEWSPDGRRLLVSWPDAGQWLLLGGRRPRAFAGVARQLDPAGTGAAFPRLSGWCCARPD